MKKILVLFSFIALFFVNDSWAQTAIEKEIQLESGKKVLEHRLQKMKANLSLSEKQVKKLRADNVQFAKRLERYRMNNDRMAKKTAIENLYKDIDASMQKHLTTKQYEKLVTDRERLMKKN